MDPIQAESPLTELEDSDDEYSEPQFNIDGQEDDPHPSLQGPLTARGTFRAEKQQVLSPSLDTCHSAIGAVDARRRFKSSIHISSLPDKTLARILEAIDERPFRYSGPYQWAAAHVCRHRRNIAASCSRIWYLLLLDLSPKNNIVGEETPEWMYHRMVQQIGWCGTRGLHVSVCLLDTTISDLDSIDWLNSSRSWGIHALRMILTQASRIANLELACETQVFPRIAHMCGIEVPSCFPRLDYLWGSSFCDEIPIDNAARLQVLGIYDSIGRATYLNPVAQRPGPLQPPRFYWSGLQSLTVTQFSWRAFNILHGCRDLQELVLQLQDRTVLIQPLEASLLLPQLRRLEVLSLHPLAPETNNLNATRNFLKSLLLPQLACFRCTHGIARGTLVILLDLARRSGWSRSLTSLHIAPRLIINRPSKAFFDDFLRELTSLEILELSLAPQRTESRSPLSEYEAKGHMTQWLGSLLLERREPGEIRTLPRLQHLHVINVNNAIVRDALFVHALESRSYVHFNTPGPGPLVGLNFLRTLVLKYDSTETDPDYGMLWGRRKHWFDVFIYEAQAQSGPLVDHIQKSYDEPLEADLEGPGALKDVRSSADFEPMEWEIWMLVTG